VVESCTEAAPNKNESLLYATGTMPDVEHGPQVPADDSLYGSIVAELETVVSGGSGSIVLN
jgi:hypothetical protein